MRYYNKILSCGCAALLGLSVFSFPSLAAEKEFSATLEKTYAEAEFSFEFADGSYTHEVVITRPDGAESSDTLTGSSGEITVGGAMEGEYKVTISSDTDEVQATVRVKGNNPTIEAEEGNLTITSNISGLAIYFVDGDLTVDWDIYNIPSVNIKVTNPRTMQVLANTTESKGTYTLPVAENVDELEVYVVSSSDAKIDGAGVTKTVSVVREVPGTVTLSGGSITNQNTFTIDVVTKSDNMSVAATCNGASTLKEDIPTAGEYSFSGSLSDTNNTVIVALSDENGNQITYTYNISKDTTAPGLKLSQTYDGIAVSKDAIEISGYVSTDTAELLVAGNSVSFDENGAFSTVVPLDMGANTVSISASDEAGNVTELHPVITRGNAVDTPSGGIDLSVLLYAGFGLAFLVLIAVVIRVRKSAQGKKTEKEPKKIIKKAPSDKKERHHEEKAKGSKVPKKKSESKPLAAKKEPVITLPADTCDKEKQKERRGRSKLTVLSKFMLDVAAVLAVYLVVTRILLIAVSPVSSSMEPSLSPGEVYYFNRVAYLIKPVERGDVIVFEQDGEYLVKRVIGIAGDTIQFRDGYVFINGAKADESEYLTEDIETNCSKEFTVPEGTVFVLGDNRENSKDSRFFDNPYIGTGSIIGKYFGKRTF